LGGIRLTIARPREVCRHKRIRNSFLLNKRPHYPLGIGGAGIYHIFRLESDTHWGHIIVFAPALSEWQAREKCYARIDNNIFPPSFGTIVRNQAISERNEVRESEETRKSFGITRNSLLKGEYVRSLSLEKRNNSVEMTRAFNIERDELQHGGKGEIRTLETLAGLPLFESGAFNHSATFPGETTVPAFTDFENEKAGSSSEPASLTSRY
jgi:hypothetical protein